MQIDSTCQHCKKPFTYEFGKGHRHRRYCDRKCQYLAAYYRNIPYHRKRYEKNKEHLLALGQTYRASDRVKRMRQIYRENYREKDSEHGKRRNSRQEEREKNRSRNRASVILFRYAARLCCHCGSAEKVNCHHVNDDPLTNEWWNLSPLCRNCHEKVHSLVFASEKAAVNRSIALFLQGLFSIPNVWSVKRSS